MKKKLFKNEVILWIRFRKILPKTYPYYLLGKYVVVILDIENLICNRWSLFGICWWFFLKWLRLGSSAFVWLDAKFFILYYIEGFFIFFFENIWKLRDKKGTAQFEIPRFEYLSKWKLLTYFISWSTITSEIRRVGPFPKCNFREVWF